MSGRSGPADPVADFEDAAPAPDERLVIDVDGFEGPLDLLLQLARDQKVDLTRISILALAEQYLAYIEAARRLSLEVAADYLVMAAWLAWLKSRLLLPRDERGDEPSGEELAAVLAERLLRLEAMREAGQRLMALPRLGVEIFGRGIPEPITVRHSVGWDASLYDLLSSYAALRLHRAAGTLSLPQRTVFSLQEARDRLVLMLGGPVEWATLDSFLSEYLSRPELQRTARASAFSASLELAREGDIELRQAAHFAPLYLRRKASAVTVRQVGHG